MKPSSLGKSTAEVRAVYDKVIEVFFFFAPIEGFDELIYPDFLGYGTAAHEFFRDREAVKQMAKLQAEQLKETKFTLTRKPVDEKFLSNGSVFLILEDFELYMEDNDHVVPLRLSTILENISGKWMVTHFHGSTPDANIDDEEALPMEGLRKKNEELEAKIRERTRDLEIEASLEKVRSQSLAMHNTSEMQLVVNAVFEQLRALGLEMDVVGMSGVIEDKQDYDVWIGGAPLGSALRIPYNEDTQVQRDYNKMLKNRPELFVRTYSGQVKKEYIDRLLTHGDFPKALKKKMETSDAFTTLIAPKKNSGIQVVRYTDQPFTDQDAEILKRFAGVFEQAYIRFMDLEKAEAQAREAQIEAALERVRARTMAMHNTEDIAATVTTFFNELMGLHQDSSIRCGIGVLSQSEHMELWTASVKDGSKTILHAGTLDMSLHPLLKGAKENWRKKGKAFSYTLKGKDLKNYFQILNEAPDYPAHFDLDALPKAVYHNSFVFRDGILFVFSETQLNQEIGTIVERFTVVFGQTYTRFLDLQKAEAQTRESQIQLSLERVRARSLAMKSSDELHEVLAVLFRQFDDLGIQPVNVFLSLFDKEKRTLTYRASGKSGKRMPGKQVVEVDSMEAIKALYDKWLNGNSDNVELIFFPKEVLPQLFGIFSETFSAMPKADRMGPEDFPEGGYSIAGYTPFGYLGYDHQRQATEEEQEILARFCTEFTRVYQRFLDLNNAEAQAREAEIQLSLERIRARTMAMQTTDELTDVLSLLFKQFDILGIAPSFAHLTLFNEENDTFSFRITGTSGQRIIAEQIIDMASYPAWYESYEKWKKGDPGIVDCIDYPPEVVPAVFEIMDPIFSKLPPDSEIKAKDFPQGIYTTQGHCRFGYIGFNHTRRATEEEKDIVRKFALEFGRLYQRFLDLKQAENQAREAQIEAALERVRAKAMAMHNTEDIGIAVTTFFNELMSLHRDHSLRCGIGILSQAEHMQLWTASVKKNSETVLHSGMLDMSLHPLLSGVKKAWINHDKSFSYVLKGQDRKRYFGILNKAPDYPVKFDLNALPETVYHNSFAFKDGMLFAFTEAPLQDDIRSVLERFSSVFGQTYTRYLDLLRAEAQAREAQIEAALERVRARSMAMHSTDEMQQVANAVYDQLAELGIEMDAVGMSGVIEAKQDYDVWVGGAPMGKALRIPYNEDSEVQRDYNRAIKDRTELFAKTYTGKVKEEYIRNLLTHGNFPRTLETKMKTSDAFTTSIAFAKNSGIQIVRYTNKPYSQEDNEVLKRFAQVFEQAYIRFRDLQKAEAQAREAQIEAALEKVRSQSLAMHNSEEIAQVAATMFLQLTKIGINDLRRCVIYTFNQAQTKLQCWYTTEDGKSYAHHFSMPLKGSKVMQKIIHCWKSGKPMSMEVSGSLYDEWGAFIRKHGWKYPKGEKPANLMILNEFPFKYGLIEVATYSELKEEDNTISARFTQVFEQVYTRFLDLQKAETQAREAQIEAALERIRSQVTGMQESSELLDIVVTMRSEFIRLGHEAHYFWHMRWLPDTYQKAMTSGEGTRIGMVMQLPRHIHGDVPLLAKWEKSKQPTVVYAMDADAAVDYVHKMVSLGDFQQVDPQAPSEGDIRKIGGLTFVMARTTHGEIGYSLPGVVPNPPAEDMNTLVRFAGVFDLAYRRFEDLKESERQKREAEIELALERVRARTMAMQHSDELAEASHLLDKEVRALGIETWGCAFNIYRKNDSIEWFGNEAGLLPTYTVPRKGIFKQYYEMGQQGESLLVKEFAGEECVAHYEYMSTLPVVGDVLRQLKETNGAFPTYQIDHVVYFKYGYLLFITRKSVPEAHDIFKRFALVFEQTYTRFLDLQKAEAQAKEAVKQASIDRIRGQIASMRTAKDLERITPLIWNELTVLGVPFIRCGVFIVHESDRTVQAFLSAPDGKSLGAMRIPFDADKDTAATVAHWKKGEVYRTHWDKKQFLEFMQTMMHLGQVSNKKEYQGAEEPPESLFLHFLPFKQGMLYVGNMKSLDEDQMEAVGSLADAFSIAYARYEDFVKLEMAKERIERTLGDLRETQKQLVHSEKMASLGELTAGIAHEIQNPLNFVNNFSEVSVELLEEMQEEISKGDLKEAMTIIEDIKQNLDKINHHGKRADGIVKGMLQHSRTSSGEKEPTDLNVLADEYLRLAYHGLRAKDKSFNATLETHFDKSIGKIDVVTQDIGRVILNLITNAFHVVKERKEKDGEGYTPTVTVTTRKEKNGVGILVQDNGDGIPEDIREKIFQPFFTTKPTGQGTGLGLSMSFDIVTKGHGGELRVHSNVGEGTTFTVWLPEK